MISWLTAAALACSLQLTGPSEGTVHVRAPVFRWATDCPSVRVALERDGVVLLLSPLLSAASWSPGPAEWSQVATGPLAWRVHSDTAVSEARTFLRDRDEDNDGIRLLQGPDCDDADPRRFPGAPEACNGLDDDCDGEVDEAEPRG